MSSRIERERAFHNERFDNEKPRGNLLSRAIHGITHDALNATYQTIFDTCRDAMVLDYGCSRGESAFICVRHGAKFVHGIDISDVAIAQAQQKATELGVANVAFSAMNAEAMAFPDNVFDLICGFGILHHLNIDRSCAELARVLKPSGTAVFLEPLGHNPAINIFRTMTPGIRTSDEHPLLVRDIRTIGQYFRTVGGHYVNLTTLATLPLGDMPGSHSLRRVLASVDRCLFRALPVVRRYAWNVVLNLSSPIGKVESVEHSGQSRG